jgi:hypothetical protein
VKLSEIRLQAHAHPRRRGKQFLNAFTGEVTEAGGRRPVEAPAAQFGALDWVTIQGERGDLARPLHPSWVKAATDDCRKHRVAVQFSGWGEWANVLHMEPALFAEKNNHDSMFMFRNGLKESTTFEADRMEFYRLGTAKAGFRYSGRLIYEYPDFTARRRANAA